MSGAAKTAAIGVLVAVTAVGALLYWYVSTHGFSARAEPSRLEAFFARRVRSLATPRSVKEMKNPVEATPLNIADARNHFADHCALCHANDGSGRTEINEGLYPPAPDMRESETQDLSDGELFYVIKEGIRFTGMPGWGGEDEENWQLVLFVRHLPSLTPKEIELMKQINGLDGKSETPADGH